MKVFDDAISETAKPLQSSQFEDDPLGSIYKGCIDNVKTKSLNFKIFSLKLSLEWHVDHGDDQESWHCCFASGKRV